MTYLTYLFKLKKAGNSCLYVDKLFYFNCRNYFFMKKNSLFLIIPFILFSCQPSNEELVKRAAPNIQKSNEKGQESFLLIVRKLQKENKFDSAQGLCVFFQKQYPKSPFISEINKLYLEINQKEKIYKDSIKYKK